MKAPISRRRAQLLRSLKESKRKVKSFRMQGANQVIKSMILSNLRTVQVINLILEKKSSKSAKTRERWSGGYAYSETMVNIEMNLIN